MFQPGRPFCLVRAVFDQDVHEMYDFTGPVLGSGAFATVLRVKDRMSGVEYAMKQVCMPALSTAAAAAAATEIVLWVQAAVEKG